MAEIAAPVLNWQSTPEPQTAAGLVSLSSIEVVIPHANITVLSIPAANQLIGQDTGVGYAG